MLAQYLLSVDFDAYIYMVRRYIAVKHVRVTGSTQEATQEPVNRVNTTKLLNMI